MIYYAGFDSENWQWVGVGIIYILIPFLVGVWALYAFMKALVRWERRQKNQEQAKVIFAVILLTIGLIIGYLLHNTILRNVK